MDASVNRYLISPIPLTSKTNSVESFSGAVANTDRSQMALTKMPSSTCVSPQYQEQKQSLRNAASKSMISSIERSEISRVVFRIIRSHLPPTIRDTTSFPQMILISNAIEKKLYQTAPTCQAYLDLDTLKLRIAALACAILIHSKEESGSKSARSETCSRLLAAARNSLPHCVMVLVSYETRELDKRFAGVANYSSNEGFNFCP